MAHVKAESSSVELEEEEVQCMHVSRMLRFKRALPNDDNSGKDQIIANYLA